MYVRRILTWLTLAACLAWAIPIPGARAEEPSPPPAEETKEGLFGELPSLGGLQFWTDEFVYGQWRIQRNALANTYRLLNEKNGVLAFGAFDHCYSQFLEQKRVRGLPPLKPRAVILLHGLMGHRDRMAPLEDYLRAHDDAEIINVGYASTRGDIAAHASALAKVVARLEGVKEIDFVAHSLGNLVVRYYLGERTAAPGDAERLPRVRRMVMVAPPNQGARLALKIGEGAGASYLAGATSRQLGSDFFKVRKHLAVPECEFGILAACCEKPQGGNPALAGDDDWVLCVEETKLEGAADFLVLPGLHHRVLQQEQTHRCVLHFLREGRFLADEPAHPLHAGNVSAAGRREFVPAVSPEPETGKPSP